MKLHIEIIDEEEEECVIVKCKKINQRVKEIEALLKQQEDQKIQMSFYKEEQEYFLNLDDILFFETQGDAVYAHSRKDAYRIKLRLYELEKTLPSDFIRISKSTIINVNDIYAIERNLSSSSRIQFRNSHKEVYVSRMFYKQLRFRLQERRKL